MKIKKKNWKIVEYKNKKEAEKFATSVEGKVFTKEEVGTFHNKEEFSNLDVVEVREIEKVVYGWGNENSIKQWEATEESKGIKVKVKYSLVPAFEIKYTVYQVEYTVYKDLTSVFIYEEYRGYEYNTETGLYDEVHPEEGETGNSFTAVELLDLYSKYKDTSDLSIEADKKTI